MGVTMETKGLTAEELRLQLIRSEGFAEGFQTGYRACVEYVAKTLDRKEINGNGIQAHNGTTESA